MDDAHWLRELADMRPYVEVLYAVDVFLAHRHHTAEVTPIAEIAEVSPIAKITEVSPIAEATELAYHFGDIEGRIEKYHSGKVIRTMVGKKS